MKNYSTEQRKAILEIFLENEHRHLSAREIIEISSKRNLNISKATIYRYLNNLTDKGIIKRIITDNKSEACYQFVTNKKELNSFHMICSECGELMHLDCEEVSHFLEHIKKDHGFNIDTRRVTFYGKCKNCMEKDK